MINMSQLFKEDQQKKILWSSGCSSFFISHKAGFSRIPLAVKCRIGDLETTELALLDTGAEWSVIGGELSEILENQIGFPEESFSMSTRLGKIFGSLYRINISLSAEFGYDITVESSVFVSQEWNGPVVLGYRGFLERIRFAFDPGIVPGEQIFYFGIPD